MPSNNPFGQPPSIVDLTTGDYHLALGLPTPDTYTLLPWNLYDGPTFDDANGARAFTTERTHA